MRCWRGCLLERRAYAYGSADATAIPSCLLQQNPEWFILLVPTQLGSSRTKGRKTVVVVVVVVVLAQSADTKQSRKYEAYLSAKDDII